MVRQTREVYQAVTEERVDISFRTCASTTVGRRPNIRDLYRHQVQIIQGSGRLILSLDTEGVSCILGIVTVPTALSEDAKGLMWASAWVTV